ncbi:hypothetical protein [Dyadobacter koreensis]|uniref:hypothetical protein n=1 Tax=Dyadobacter koreensis TaxID=408657 RepID=UPI000B83BF03|nr:hypothetical protein [Dyadobacter koreensis]
MCATVSPAGTAPALGPAVRVRSDTCKGQPGKNTTRFSGWRFFFRTGFFARPCMFQTGRNFANSGVDAVRWRTPRLKGVSLSTNLAGKWLAAFFSLPDA